MESKVRSYNTLCVHDMRWQVRHCQLVAGQRLDAPGCPPKNPFLKLPSSASQLFTPPPKGAHRFAFQTALLHLKPLPKPSCQMRSPRRTPCASM